jgi:acyl transferase domain-containing protein/thioesterase domain-containing protein
VKSGVVLDEFDGFDAEFFGFSPKEAAILDPQHRHFLECAWEALEDAGHPPDSFDGSIGMFGGCGMGAYFAFNLLTNGDLVEREGLFLLRHTGNDKDFLTTRVSYCLNLRGPSVSVQTACSTSLVATHLACQSLLSGECDMALAGGVTIEIPHKRGYLYQPGEILSPDGHCRAFDRRSEGTIFGSGAGIVVLRRLADALRDGDRVYAVIKGSAVNNDGARKAGYLAPSVDGQSAAVVEALGVARVPADSIGYLECHGTGTKMGDPIEISALTQAFRRSTARTEFCGVGSVKTNIGHLDTAAGVASLIKATLALANGRIPPTLHFESPNPEIDFANSPFFVCDKGRAWPRTGEPRRAAVNSLGVGGTNAFVVLEEAPPEPSAAASARPDQLFVLSAKSRAALDAASARLADHLDGHDDDFADVAFTLAEGRRAFAHRRVVAAKSREEASRLLRDNDPRRVFTHVAEGGRRSLAFMFPGGGAQYPRMAHDLYVAEPVFREWIDRGLGHLRELDIDLSAVMFPDDSALAEAAARLERPSVQLPAIFLVEYALAKLWMSWGVEPSAFIGHSLGETTAACLAEVMQLEDALRVVVLRGRLMDEVPEGAMLSVSLPAKELAALLGNELDLASVNAPDLSVASGPRSSLEALERTLAARGVDSKWIPIRIAAHSRMLDPILDRYRAGLSALRLSHPKVPIVSNRTGTWLTNENATDPNYWVSQLRSTVLFADGVKTLLEEPGRVLLEVGPGKTLGSLARQHPDIRSSQAVLSSLRHPEEAVADTAFFLTVFGRLWAAGVDLDLATARGREKRRRVGLPGYPFEHRRYFIEPGRLESRSAEASREPSKVPNVDAWFYRPTWIAAAPPPPASARASTWLLLVDQAGIGDKIAEKLRRAGHQVICVRQSDAYYQLGPTEYRLSPEHGKDGYDALVRDLVAEGKLPDRVLHLWLVASEHDVRPGSSLLHRNQERGFYSLLFLAQALGEQGRRRPTHAVVVSNGMQQVDDEPVPHPDQATVLGPCKVIPRELSGFTCSSVDITLPSNKKGSRAEARHALEALTSHLMAELAMEPANRVVAVRGNRRFEQNFERISLEIEGTRRPLAVRRGGAYLVTGGLGGIGLTLARHLASHESVKLVLVSRSELPDRASWDGWLATHDASDPIARRIAGVRDLESMGAEVEVIAADVTDLERMRAGLDAAERRFGPIRGVLHAAGVMKDELLQTKTQSSAESVFAPKVYGTLVLDALLGRAPLDFLLLFSSTSTVTGPAGQIDYVAANAFLNAYAQSRRSSGPGAGCKTIAVNWGIWNEVGMAADAAAGLASGEAASPSPLPVRHPLLASRATEGERHVFSASFAPRAQWILSEHRTIDGRALVPGTAYLEIAGAALTSMGEKLPFQIRDLFFLRPIAVGDEDSRIVRTKLRPNEEGYDFEVQSRTGAAAAERGWEVHATARLVIGEAGPRERIDLAAIASRCSKRTDRDPNGIASKQENHLRFGPRWRSLREAAYGEREALGRLELPDGFASDLDSYALHPALLDVATGFAMDLIEGYQGDTLWVPVSYGRVVVRAPLPARFSSWVTLRERIAPGPAGADAARSEPPIEFASFDVVLADDHGEVLVRVEELTIRKLSSATDFAVTKSPTVAELELDPPTARAARAKSPAELAFVRQLEQGILPAEGCAVLDRVLAKIDGPLVIASSLDLFELREFADRAALAKEETGTSFARPALATAYTAPRDDIERTLVEYWQELLGVDKVGVDDSFFELGGHSLVAVRLFAKIKSAYRVDYPISVLFEAPTIARCAALIKSTVDAKGTPARDAAQTRRTRYTHLVAMHADLDKRAERRAPFFLVAGMFGNVLNLRHLAHLIGRDRRFYGLQARGLYGDHTPHETFEAMATDYIAELRTIQPSGPYFLGGFSGGGVTAYEMARQFILAGESVALLVLLDTPLPMTQPLTSSDRWKLHLHQLRTNGASHIVEWMKDRYEWETSARRRRTDPADVKKPFDFHSEAIEAAFRRACARYQPAELPLRVALFRPKLDEHAVLGPGRVINRQRRFIYHDNGWGRFVPAVDVYEVPGDHDSMVLEPNVRVLAARLRACIEDAESAPLSRDLHLIRPGLALENEPLVVANDTGTSATVEVVAMASAGRSDRGASNS